MSRRSRTILTPGNVTKILALVAAIAGFYHSPYGPNSSAQGPEGKAAQGQVYRGTVVRVADGDTITVRDTDGAQHKVRLHAVDAPELKQAHGLKSQGWLSDQLLNETVKVRVMDKDRYQREVAKVLIPGPDCGEPVCGTDQDVNLQLIEHGMAWWYREFAKSQTSTDRSLYNEAEKHARSQRLGLWAQPTPQAPWEWRAQQRALQNHAQRNAQHNDQQP